MRRTLLFLGVLALCLILYITWLISSQEKGSVIDGRLVLAESANDIGSISLDGDWEFYWDQLIDPAGFENQDTRKNTLMNVPGLWNFEEDGKYPAAGQATYRLVIEVPHATALRDTDHPALLLPRIFT